MIGSRETQSQRLRAGRSGADSPLKRAAASLLSLLLALLVLVLPGSTGPSQALGLPGRSPRPAADSTLPLAASAPAGLQEVAPPLAVQQLQEAMAGRQPRVEILAPTDGTLLPPGPWSLRLRVHDWPLVDGGALGIGPHLVVQLDDEAPLRLTDTEITLPALAPGSHRLTVFAARPWGEAAKNPGAWSQIRLHRSAANPLALPPPGQAQLIAVSPAATAATEPLLLDWLLLDAPLQNLRTDDGRWRLRVTINDDSFVIDRQTPLWLKGWKPGGNAIRLELLDGRGEPLTPPFNSLVRDVELSPAQPAARWQQGPLSAGELAILLGEATADLPQSASGTDLEPQVREEAVTRPGNPDPASAALPTAAVTDSAAASTSGKATAIRTAPAEAEASSTGSASAAPSSPEQASASPSPAPPTPAASPRSPASEQAGTLELTARRDPPEAGEDGAPPSTPPRLEPSTAPSGSAQPKGPSLAEISRSEPGPSPGAPARPGLNEQPISPPLSPGPDPAPAGSPPGARPMPLADASAAARDAGASQAPGGGSLPPSSPEPAAPNLPAPAPVAMATDSLRLSPSSSSSGPAREQVNPDGTMIQPSRRGPLAGLRERLLP